MSHQPAEVTFVGTATTVLRIGPFTLLTDPNFLHAGERAYLGYGMWSRRRTEPAFGPAELPVLDAVLLSHLHGDHFDRVARRGLAHHVPIVTTNQAERRLNRWGFTAVTSLNPWDAYELRTEEHLLRVTSVPGQHGPALIHRLLPDVMGSVVDWEVDGRRVLRLYITGDTLFRPMLAQIAERFPDIDVMLLHLGGTRIAGVLLTMNAAQGISLIRTVNPAVTMPIHYDDYPVFREPLSRFLDRCRAEGLAGGVRTIVRGETAPLGV